MSRFGKLTVVTLLSLPFALGGCKPNKKTANPEDYYPLIQVALQAGGIGAMIARNEAIEKKNFGGCVAADVLADAFSSAGDALQARIADEFEIPAFEMDLTDCLALRPAEEGDESASMSGPVVAVLVCGEEPVAEEPPAEEPAAEEPAAEEPAAEEEDSDVVDSVLETKGNPDAAVLVEAIAGVTLTAALYYANKLKTANCKKGVAALAAIHYVNGMVKPVADEIAEPDGKVSVAAVKIDFSECK